MMVWFKNDLYWYGQGHFLSSVYGGLLVGLVPYWPVCHGLELKFLKINILGCLTLIPGGLEITENDLIYVNSSVIVAIGESKECFWSHGMHPRTSSIIIVQVENMQKLFIADCQLQKFPVLGLYMIQEMRWNRLFR